MLEVVAVPLVEDDDLVQALAATASDHPLATGCLREAARKKRKLVERDLLPRVFDRDGAGARQMAAALALAAIATGPAARRRSDLHHAVAPSIRYLPDADPTGTYAAISAEDRWLGARAMVRGEF